MSQVFEVIYWFEIINQNLLNLCLFSLDGDNDSGVDESTQGNVSFKIIPKINN